MWNYEKGNIAEGCWLISWSKQKEKLMLSTDGTPLDLHLKQLGILREVVDDMRSFQILRKNLPPLQRAFDTPTSAHKIRPSPLVNQIVKPTRRKWPTTPFSQRRPNSTNFKKPSYNPTPHLNSPEPSLSLSQRLRKLSREYGWSAFGVYFLLSLLDFPFCFAAVRYLGTDRVGHYEHVVLEWIKSALPASVVEKVRELRQKMRRTAEDNKERGAMVVGGLAGQEAQVETYGNVMKGPEVGVVPGYDHGVKEATKMNESENASKLYGHRPLL